MKPVNIFGLTVWRKLEIGTFFQLYLLLSENNQTEKFIPIMFYMYT